MLKVAERITAGEWQGFVFGMDESGEVLDVRWDYGDLDRSVPGGWDGLDLDSSGRRNSSVVHHRTPDPKARASFAAADLSRPNITGKRTTEYQDPWATPPEEPDLDEGGNWNLNWGVD
ncbi:hypothetical protein M406DRAFT_322998 [Cryphonectria parasitica EP155]|uniref:Uncharacterized protein n=1 Tax=Cryphonectria parasitica (strain ATCC 38755 / EP155) TaxID=660469 RepID=A0A9P4XY59_CRYP1|nr:uncharacterized protein M406DRAFT_322998 [Cryphonectria parasitica EP155]KAF3763058.1 hypothetical protein M406DRAFT_322998 [Cryphonectria parasitica EP155]